jgi:outer membrane protein
MRADARLLAAIADNRASAQSVPQARSQFLPQVRGSVGQGTTSSNVREGPTSTYRLGRSRYPGTDYAVSVEQALFNYSAWLTLAKAEAQVRASDAELEAARQDMLLRTVERYLIALVTLEQIDAARAERRALETHRDLVAARARGGQARSADLLDVEARLLRASSRELEASAVLRDALQALAELTGQPLRSLNTLALDLPGQAAVEADPQVWVDRAIADNPRLIALRMMQDVARREVSRQYAEGLPRLAIVAEQERRRSDGSIYGGRSDIETQSLQLRATMTLYAGGLQYHRAREAQAGVDRAGHDLEAEARSVARRVRGALDGIATAASRVVALRAALRAQEEVVRTARAAFAAGLSPSLAALEAERNLFLTRFELSQARHQYLLETVRLKHAVGGLSGQDLDSINGLLKPEPTDLANYVAGRR